MLPITTLRLEPCSPANPWSQIVRTAVRWGSETHLEWRDAVVVVPFAQHLPWARRAWAEQGGWMPRIETTQTLARSLGPGDAPQGAQITFSTAVDRLTVRRMLRAQTWAAAWARGDAAAFEQGAQSVVKTAQALARACAALAPSERSAYWVRGRSVLDAIGGPGATERALLRLAFEWAAAAATPSTDALFTLRASAWVVVQAGGPDALAMSLLEAAPHGVPRLIIDTDADPAEPFAAADAGRIVVATCADFEDEAQATAAQVIAALARGHEPVALVSHDRLLTRRVRALLARRDVPLQDETGWKLSTTRAAGAVVSLLRAARPDAGSDDWLDWLKNCAGEWPGLHQADSAALALESELRKRQWTRPASIDPGALQPVALTLWSAAAALLRAYGDARVRTLAGWLHALHEALTACGAWRSLQADDAGRQVLAALHLANDAAGSGAASLGAVGDERMSAREFDAWVDAVLEEGSFLPAAASGAPVIVTPLERAMLRPFGAVVMPGVDEKRLGGTPAPLPLLGDALAVELRVPTLAQRRDAEVLAFAQTLRAPRLVLLRRVDDGGESIAPSPLLERLRLSLQQRGGRLRAADDERANLDMVAAPVSRPVPSAAALLPSRLSPSACEALRTCPYQFFATRMLGLRETEELDDEVEKRDYGTWLHAVLHCFHAERPHALPSDVECARLHQVAQETRLAMGFDAAAFLPFVASFARFAPRYVEWLHAREAEGLRWLDGEVAKSTCPPTWQGIELHGRIDRIDRHDGRSDAGQSIGGPRLELIDYKTGSRDKLCKRVKAPLEDTQLALYAALMLAEGASDDALTAGYLPLDDSGQLDPVRHVGVGASAPRVVAGIGHELARIRAGAALPALGEGAACEHCAVRGLCRRDHWRSSEPGA